MSVLVSKKTTKEACANLISSKTDEVINLESVQKIPFNTIGRAQGLSSGQVHDTAEADNGLIWFAGPNGLARYDGSRIRIFGQSDGLATHGTRSVCAAPDGRVFVGSDAGVDMIDNDGKVSPITTKSKWSRDVAECLAAGPDGRLWIGTTHGLLWWSESDGVSYAKDDQLHSGMIFDLAFDHDGSLWAAGQQCGLLRCEADHWRSIRNSDWRTVGLIRTLCCTRRSILVGGEKGLIEIDKDGNAMGDIYEWTRGRSVTAVFANEMELFVGIDGRLDIFQRKSGNWVFHETVFRNSIVNRIRSDSDGNIWCATDTRGVAKISALRNAITRIRLPGENPVMSINRKSNGDYLIGGARHSFLLNFNEEISLVPITGLDRLLVWDILEDRTGSVWAATDEGLFRREGSGQFERVAPSVREFGSPTRVLLERENSLWIGTLGGLVEISEGNIRQILDPRQNSLGYVYTLTEDRRKQVWIGTLGNGLWRQTDSELKRIEGKGISETGSVYSVAVNEDGRVALIQDNRILVMNSDKDIKVIAETEGAVAGWVIIWGAGESVWVGSSNGLREYDIEKKKLVRQVTALMSLDDWEFTTSRSLIRNESNRFICGTNGGLVVVDPVELAAFNAVPVVALENISWKNARVATDKNRYTVEYGKWTFEASVRSGWFVDEKDVRYRFRLREFDENWSELSLIASVRYNSLPVGHYILEAQAFSSLNGFGPKAELMRIHVTGSETAPRWSDSLTKIFSRKKGE